MFNNYQPTEDLFAEQDPISIKMGLKDIPDDLSKPFTSKPILEKFTKPFERKPDTARQSFYDNRMLSNQTRMTMDVDFHTTPNQLYTDYRKGK
jgi:aldehyde:ferredoxin oxidoreductase